jgi:hypothetical protein
MTSSAGFSPIEEGIAAGFARAAQFDVAAAPQGQLFEAMNDVLRDDVAGERSIAYFSEVMTVANAGRESVGERPLDAADVKLAFSFWEWLFDGLVRR